MSYLLFEKTSDQKGTIICCEKKDPVCQMSVHVKYAVTADYDNIVYYFCSQRCQDKFLKAPKLFLSEKHSNKYCVICQNEILDESYIKEVGPYCCEKYYYKDKFLGDVLEKIEGVYLTVVESFVEAIDAREHEVGNHSYRVAQFSMIISPKLR